MAAALLIASACALLAQGQAACLGGYAAPLGGYAAPLLGGCGLGYDAYGYDGLAPFGLGCGVASTGGGLPCASASPFPPVGVSVLSENVYEGGLTVGGNLPFLGTVSLEGVLPTAGAGAVSYGCGSPVGIAVEEGPIATGVAPHAPGPFVGGLGYQPYGAFPYAEGLGCGCGYGYRGFGALY